VTPAPPRGRLGATPQSSPAPPLAGLDDRLEAQRLWHSGAFLLETVPTVLYTLARHGAAALPERWRAGLLGRTTGSDDRHLFETLDRLRTDLGI